MIVRLCAGDPGFSDPYGFVGIELDTDTGKIYIKLAKIWVKTNFDIVARDISRIYHNIKPQAIGIEKNNHGVEAIKSLHKFDLPIISINTSANITNFKKMHSVYTMDKTNMVKWFVTQKRQHNIIFPKTNNKDMRELIRQISEFTQYKTRTGNDTFQASKSGHDDLMLSLLLVCHLARKYMNRLMVNKKI